ncbi:MAG: phage tail tip lysozyme, partial [Candidatus Saccharimonadales bacterium]
MALGHRGRQYALRRRGAGMKKNRLIHRDTVTRPLTVLIVCSILLSLVRVPLVRAIACPPEWPSPDCNGIVSNGGTDWIPEMATCTTTDSNSNTAEQAIAQTLILGFNVNTPKDVITDLATKYRFGGIYPLGTTDAASKGFDKAFYDSLGAAATIPLLVSSDEEGVVTRYAYPPGSFPSAAVMATKTDSEVQEIGKTAGEVMALSGITVDLAPVLDLRDVGIAGRAFSSDPAVIAAKAGAFAAGLSGSGVRPVFKHFPGFSDATQPSNGNTDTEKVVLKGDITKNVEPYREVLKTHANGAVMLSNLYVEKLDGDNPASLSKKVVDYLRTDVGFTGLVTTDDIAVKSVTDKAGSVGKAVAGALAAGVTMPLLTLPNAGSVESAEKTMDEIITAVKDNEDAAAAVINASSIIQGFKGSSGTGTPSSSCCAGVDFPNGNTEDNARAVFEFLTTTAKLPAVQAAGIVGNMYIESSVLPQRLEGTGPEVITTAEDYLSSGSTAGWGVVQFTPGTKFINSKDPSSGSAAHSVADANKLSTQVSFVWDQLEGRTDRPEKTAGDDIKALATNPDLKDNL